MAHHVSQSPPQPHVAHPRFRSAPALALMLLLAACGGPSGDTAAPVPPIVLSMTTSLLAAPSVTEESQLAVAAVSASSAERGDLGAAAAVDNNPATRWGSGFSDNQWLTLDFGSSKAITRVKIQWENAHALAYALQTSDDGSTWTTIKSVENSVGGVEDIGALAGQGRYLRVQGIRRATQYGYSILEIQAFSSAVVTTPPATDLPSQDVSAAIKPAATSSSALENPGLSSAMAVDGNPATRWASTFDDAAWLQFDFGVKSRVGYMKLVWEASYAKQYAIQVSDDGRNWSQVRYVDNGQGGTEELFDLGINSRYVRLQGVKRSTNYGYSLFEVSFKSPGIDNSVPTMTTSVHPFPTSGADLAPLPAAAEALESLQFTLPDGTMVTRFGARGMARHGRERGEEWNEIGYGLNETIDLSTGLPRDKGPGNFLSFVPQYFKNRTWGVEIIDNSRVAGVTTPTLTLNQYTTVDFLPGGVAFFRAFDRPGVTGYGWMNPGELVDRNVAICKPLAYPANGKLTSPNGINNACTLRVKQYPGHGGLDAAGFPNGRDVPARSLVAGDIIEVSPSMFSTRESMDAAGDSGGVRYYSNEWVYVVGTGLRPWYGVQPRLNSVPLPASALSGGSGSVSYNYTDEGMFMFQQPHNNVGMQNMQRFVSGRRLVHTNFATGAHNEPGNDRYQAAIGLQGQRFNQNACIGCHVNNGRSPAPFAQQQLLDGMSVRVAALGAAGEQLPHPRYGSAVQMRAASATGAPQNWGNGVRVAGFETQTVKLGDGTAVELRKPTLAFEGPVPAAYSLRAAQPMIGAGLLEAIPEASILARVRTTPDQDGVKGVANYVFDGETGAVRLGRFGWKASKATLRQQTAAALLQDMSVTSKLYPNRTCDANPAGCATAAPQKGIAEADLQSITHYLALVGVPAQRSVPSGFPKGVAPIDEHRVDAPKIAIGAQTFQTLRCVACHAAETKTGAGHLFAELRNQTIRPYTDMLLHDMGPNLADKLIEGQASGSMWRTAPLWGLGYTGKVMGANGKVGYLHDGRARNVTEAIMWHGGEATRARQRFESISAQEREALLAFLASL